MKNNMIKYFGAAAVALGLATAVQAIPIAGSIGFTGSYTQVGGTAGELSTATSMTLVNVAVNPFSTTGVFVGAGAPLSFASPIGVNGNPPAIGQLWSVTVGSDVYTFTVTSESQTFTSAIQLNLAGLGTIQRNGSDATDGEWQLGFGVSGNSPNVSFTWQATSADRVPDGGTTAMLLGTALSALALIRRKL